MSGIVSSDSGAGGSGGSGRSRELRAEKIREDIAKRVRPVCMDLSDEEFAALIDKMTREQLRGEGRC